MKQLVIIDLGSNSIRLILARVGKNGNFRIVHDLKESVRLEKDMGEEQTIKPDRMKQAVKTMQMFRNLCNAIKPDEVIVVATEAIRRAANQQEFLDKILQETGFKIRVLSGEEEAYYDYLGIINSMEVSDALMMDLGGGSTELVWMENAAFKNAVSLPFGSINITQQFEMYDTVQEERMQALKEMLSGHFQAVPWLNEKTPKRLIGVGGSFRNLGKIHRRRKGYPLEIAHNYSMQPQDVLEIKNDLSSLNLKQRRNVKGLSKDRADIVVGAAAIIAEIIEFCGIEELAVSGYGLREGIIFEYLQQNHPSHLSPLDFSIHNNQLNFMLDQEHARTIWKISSSLCRQLQEIMPSQQNYDRVLKTAAMLHDTGILINYYQQNEHLIYTLLNTELHGLSHREIVLSAYIGAFHNSTRSLAMPNYKSLLTEEDIKVIPAIGILLRIARSLDRSMSGLIQDVQCMIREDKVIIKTVSGGNIELEIYDALRYCTDFRKIFKKDLYIM